MCYAICFASLNYCCLKILRILIKIYLDSNNYECSFSVCNYTKVMRTVVREDLDKVLPRHCSIDINASTNAVVKIIARCTDRHVLTTYSQIYIYKRNQQHWYCHWYRFKNVVTLLDQGLFQLQLSLP